MIQSISYTEKLDKYVEKENLIPYRLHKNARYRTNCYYWIDYDRKWFRVDEVEYDFSTAIPTLGHATVEWMDGLWAYICTDLTIYDFRLERDKYNIRNMDIINSEESFAGGEIEYWLFKHKVNFIEKKYKGFQKYFDRSGNSAIDSSKYYFIKADLVNGEYKNVKLILDTEHEKFYKPLERNTTTNESYIINMKSDDITREKRRLKRSHERK